jgi:DNA-binding beta-propeller fold protein YncE
MLPSQMRPLLLLALLPAALAATPAPPAAPTTPAAAPNPAMAPIALPSSKQLLPPVPGAPRPTNSFPGAAAVSPDGRFVVLLDSGFGTAGTDLHQSLTVLDRTTGTLTEVPQPRLAYNAAQTFFLGLGFSPDGTHLYAAMASLSDPEGQGKDATGNGVAVYRMEGGTPVAERFLAIPVRMLPPDRATAVSFPGVAPGTAVPWPAGLAVLPGPKGDRLLVAANLSDEVIQLDVATGAVLRRFDVGGHWVPSAYPYAVVASRDGEHAWVSLWNASAVAELDLTNGTVRRRIPLLPPVDPGATGSHPTALLLDAAERHLYVALANADTVAVIAPRTGKVQATWSTRLPGQSLPGATPDALVLVGDDLLVADAGANAVAVLDAHHGTVRGFVPTEWYPTALAVVGDEVYVATGKGRGTGPNNGPPLSGSKRAHPYIASILPGSVARLDWGATRRDLPALTNEVIASNRMHQPPVTVPAAAAEAIRHVVYIVRENRTYDQVLGDLGVGDGDPSLTLYGADVTPNAHALARSFGVLDRFYCSGEVSGDGHVWSTTATSSDHTERTWQIGYRSDQRTYDYEGQAGNRVPMEMGFPLLDEPASGYLWAAAERQGVTHRNYGEFVTTLWCDEPATAPPGVMGTPLTGGATCPDAWIEPGEPLPGDAPNPWPWPIPVVARNVPTTPALVGHFAADFADFRMDYPDQLRADTFLRDFQGWVAARAAGAEDPMPEVVILRLPNDHTAGTRPGFPTPSASVADNDLALGRVVEAISASVYWQDTAILVLEDDAQDGADHVDAHRSPALVVSRFSPSHPESPLVDSTSYTTVSLIRTLEDLVGLPPMNNNDAWAPAVAPLLAGPGDHPPFTADTRNRDNGLLYRTNAVTAPGSGASLGMDFTHADQVDTALLNAILWQDRKGDVPMPEARSSWEDEDD